jgi:hypothetical protein
MTLGGVDFTRQKFFNPKQNDRKTSYQIGSTLLEGKLPMVTKTIQCFLR